ncbi:MAG: hypothetical protein IIY08_06375 [Cellulosilyticum sp.]|nr:hypothetical protein [Cellulosilyticum sp.]
MLSKVFKSPGKQMLSGLFESRENLEKALQSFNGTLLFISHDRYFINKLADKVSEVEDCQITNYIGTYDEYR